MEARNILDDNLKNIRNALMKAGFKDLVFREKLRDDVLQKLEQRQTERGQIMRLVKGFKPIWSITILLIFFVGLTVLIIDPKGKQELSGNNYKVNMEFNDSKLKIDNEIEGGNRTYKPTSLQIAKESVQYNFLSPSYIPFEQRGETSVVISDWDGDKKRIFLKINYVPKKQDPSFSEFITLEVANFKNIVNSTIINKDYDQEIKLKNGAAGYYTVNKNIVLLCWKYKDIEYVLSYYSNDEDKSKHKVELQKMADSME